jgi:tRNA dimethylallyltransferase
VPRYVRPAVQIGLEVPRADLDARIAGRVETMFAAGLVSEVRELAARGLRDGRTASRALGYAQVLRLLDGEWDEATAREDTVRATRKFARRQASWFGRDGRVRWLPYNRPDLARAAVDLVAAAVP